jgi:homoserine kinase
MQKVTIRVPATSANCGPGFDCLGLACTLYNTFTFERIPEGVETSGEGRGADTLPKGRRNLAAQSFYRLWEELHMPETGLRIFSHIEVPVSRGLGSSSTAVVAGLAAANQMAGSPLSPQELVTRATEIEGHPDNVAPAILGGLTVSILADGKVHSLKVDVAKPLQLIALVPEVRVSTAKARAAIPHTIAHKDAVFSSSRAALLVAALLTGHYECLQEALLDKLHTPYRMPLIPGCKEALTGAVKAGAYQAIISGSGSTLLAYAPMDADRDKIGNALLAPFEKRGIEAHVHFLDIDREGAKVL